MSISRNKHEDNDVDFSNIVYDTSSTDKDTKSKIEEPRERKAPETTETAEATAKKSGYLIDTLLVIILLLMVGAGGYYVKIKMDEYRVPTEYEQASAEYESLQAEFNQLSSDAQTIAKIQRINSLQSKIVSLDEKLEKSKSTLKKTKEDRENLQTNLQIVKQAIDTARYELRNKDDVYRDIALAKLPNLQLPVVLNRKNNTIIKNAYIKAVERENKTTKLHIKSDNGDDVHWPVKYISREELPAVMLYALGYADFVDMSILDEPGNKKKARKRQIIDRSAPVSPNRTVAETGYGYNSASGTPTIINSRTETISADPTASPEYEPLEDPAWQAPDGALPIHL